ncbi:hypothetical protein MIDIC_450002 [Alphaproteobacteria bacterium]
MLKSDPDWFYETSKNKEDIAHIAATNGQVEHIKDATIKFCT